MRPPAKSVGGEVNLYLEHLRGVGGAPRDGKLLSTAPRRRLRPPKTEQQKKNGDMMMISDIFYMFWKMTIRETLTRKVKNLPRKQKQHRDLQRRGVREEPPGGARCSGLQRRRGLQDFWQRGSPGSGRGCSCRRRRRHHHPHRQ